MSTAIPLMQFYDQPVCNTVFRDYFIPDPLPTTPNSDFNVLLFSLQRAKDL